jgi:menaquinone-9 beta-reductase
MSFIIIGAGIAGLSAANYLVDQAVRPIIIEADTIGRHKVCGEFFSPEAVPFLRVWGIPLILIHTGNFITPYSSYRFPFDQPAGSISRALCETYLAQRAVAHGAQVLTNTRVMDLHPPDHSSGSYRIVLSNGITLESTTLIIASGRVGTQSSPAAPEQPRYIGIKAHFTGIAVPHELTLYITDNAYMGVTYVEKDKDTVNICCLARKDSIDKVGDVSLFIEHLIKNQPTLKHLYGQGRCLYQTWLVSPVRGFGKKITPQWPNAYFIGDAIATIPPASGNGLAMGLTSGIMAAHYALRNLHTDFKNAWATRYTARLRWAQLLHYMGMHPRIASCSFAVARVFPQLPRMVYKFTRDH